MGNTGYFAIKTNIEYSDGLAAEGYVSYDFGTDEFGLDGKLDVDRVCAYREREKAETVLGRVDGALRDMSVSGVVAKYETALEDISDTVQVEKLREFRVNGACYYYSAVAG